MNEWFVLLIMLINCHLNPVSNIMCVASQGMSIHIYHSFMYYTLLVGPPLQRIWLLVDTYAHIVLSSQKTHFFCSYSSLCSCNYFMYT